MIQFKDYEKTKESFRSIFNKDVNDHMTVQIKPKEGYIRFAAHDRFGNLRELRTEIITDGYMNYKNVSVSSVSKTDVLWDFIQNKNGFWYECYPVAYGDLETISKEHGTKYDICQIVFHTKRKSYVYTTLQCDSIKAIY